MSSGSVHLQHVKALLLHVPAFFTFWSVVLVCLHARVYAHVDLLLLTAVVLAVDAPTIRPGDLAPLLASGGCYEGLPVPMALDAAALPPDAEAGWPLRRLVERAGLRALPVPEGALLRLRGANTPEERDGLLRG